MFLQLFLSHYWESKILKVLNVIGRIISSEVVVGVNLDKLVPSMCEVLKLSSMGSRILRRIPDLMGAGEF